MEQILEPVDTPAPSAPPKRRIFRRLFRWGCLALALTLVGTGAEALFRARLTSRGTAKATTIFTRPTPWGNNAGPNHPIAIGTLDGSPLELRRPIKLGDVPDQLVNAILAVEDQHFFTHHGIDLRRIAGAMLANIRAGGIAQGGSTITQQLSKNLFLTSSRTPLRKVREAAMAAVLEWRYPKSTILTAYLNEIYLGQDGGRAIHGVGAASRYYFGKDVSKITIAEAALLAGMIHAPNRYAPERHPDDAKLRRDLVLRLMVEQGRIKEKTGLNAARSKVATRPHPAEALDTRYFRDYLATSSEKVAPRGKSIYTTVDAALQRAATGAVQRGLDRLSKRGAEGALVAIDPRTGDILAMVGGKDYQTSQFNRATSAQRQPGSAFKPIVALAALEPQRGERPTYTLASVVADEPLRVHTAKGNWEPENYDHNYRGQVTVRQALEESLNVPFARIGIAVGPQNIAEMAHRLGVTAPMTAVPSLALGASEVTLLELVRAYGVLAAGGELAPTRSTLASYDSVAAIQGHSVSRQRVVDPAVAYLVTSALQGVVDHGTGHALNEDGQFGDVAGKTGTSSNWRDAWFVAYTSSLVVGVWVGFDDGRSLGSTGASAALPIAEQFLEEAARQDSWEDFEVPDGIEESYVAQSHNEWGMSCGEHEYFLEGTAPASVGCIQLNPGEWGEELGQMIPDELRRQLRDLIRRQVEIKRPRRPGLER